MTDVPEKPDAEAATIDARLLDVARADSVVPLSSELREGEMLGPYRVLSKLGEGGMGVVYRAEDEALRRTVALKVMPDASGHPERRQRFLREARSAAAISHPNVATVYQVGEAGARIYIAMEFVEGENLRERMGRGRLDLASAKDLAGQIARGLAAAHDKGLVHRDLKPENVMITPSGTAKLLDFGLDKSGVEAAASGKTKGALAKTETVVTSDEGRIMGTPEYMSPEQALGEPLDVRSDVFSFGIVVYEMLSGSRPFAGTTTGAILVAIARDAPAPLRERAPDVDETTAAIVTRCLAKAPSERFGSAGEVVTALLQQISSTTTATSRTDVEPITRTGTAPRGNKTPLAVIALVFAALAGVVAWRASSRSPSSAPMPVASAGATTSALAANSAAISSSANPEAQAFFDQAMRAFHDGSGQAIPLLQSAVKADPNFGGAYLRLWWLVATPNLGSDAQEHVDEYHRRVIALQGTLSPRDRVLLACFDDDDPTRKSKADKLDVYLTHFPDDDVARTARALCTDDVETVDRLLAAEPTLVPLMALKASWLSSTSTEQAAAVVDDCLVIAPYAADCLSVRAVLLDEKGDCSAAEAVFRTWLNLVPNGRDARPRFAGVLAAQGAPSAAVRDALGADTRSPTGDGQVVFDALVPMYEGDFSEVERLAEAARARVPADANEAEHFVPSATLVSAYLETGDVAHAGRVATDYLADRPAWKQQQQFRVGMMIGAAARAGLLATDEASRRLDDAFRSLVKGEWAPEEAWAAVYAYASDTQAEARGAVSKFDTLHAAVPEGWRGASSHTFFLAGRYTVARPLLERFERGCSNVLLVSRNRLRAHLYLGEIDEQSGDKAAACARYAKVLERWGHAKPRSVTADEARVHATKLGCVPGGR